jgi:transposase InsO family protein
MPWQERDTVSLRTEFVLRARQEGANIAALCRAYEISRKTAYKWLGRSRDAPADPLTDRRRTPHAQPRQTAPEVEAAVIAMRQRYPCWGARKLAVKLRAAGGQPVPAPSTITVILQRHGLLPPRQPRVQPATRRFEHPHAHALWQMDFMGHRELDGAARVHPLTIMDDHSRALLSLTACADEQLETVWPLLWACLGRYGLPQAILTDNGPPWGTSGAKGMTRLEAWLLRLGVELWHGRPLHPQTQGKVERLHRTISVEAFGTHTFRDLAAAQHAFDAFRTTYNEERPHDALDAQVPLVRLSANPRRRPRVVPAPVYAPEDILRVVRAKGTIGFAGRRWYVSSGVIGETVAVRPTAKEGSYQVYFCHTPIGVIDVHQPGKGVTPVSEHL